MKRLGSRIQTSLSWLILVFVPFAYSCSVNRAGPFSSQEFRSNRPCKFYVDGNHVGSGRKITARLSNADHAVKCESEGYRDKVEYIYPPYGEYPVNFTFLVEDKIDAPESWARKRLREKEEGKEPVNLGVRVVQCGSADCYVVSDYGFGENREEACGQALSQTKKEVVEFMGITVNAKTTLKRKISSNDGQAEVGYEDDIETVSNNKLKLVDKETDVSINALTGAVNCKIEARYEAVE